MHRLDLRSQVARACLAGNGGRVVRDVIAAGAGGVGLGNGVGVIEEIYIEIADVFCGLDVDAVALYGAAFTCETAGVVWKL